MPRAVRRPTSSLLTRLFTGLLAAASLLATAAHAGPRPDCGRPLTLALHDHGLLYSELTGEGIDKDIADELTRRSGCKIGISVLPRARIWQLIESGALDFSLSGITSESRDRFAAFAWYVTNKYSLLVRKDAGVKSIAEFEHAPDLRLGVIRAFRYNPDANRLVDRLADAQRVSYAASLAPLYQVLLDKRIHAMIIEPFDYPALERAAIREQTTVLEFTDPAVPHGLIMSKASLPAAQRRAWAEIVDEMRADGTMLRIFEKYFAPELAKRLTQF